MADPSADHFLHFTDRVPEEYHCTICTKVLNEPMLTDCCGQHFCKVCLENWFETNVAQQTARSCPHCRSSNFNYMQDLPVKRRIDALEICCPNNRQGCNKTFPFRTLNEHLRVCEYTTIDCINKCGMTLLRKDLQEHYEQSCLRRMVQCECCGVSGTYIEIITNHQNASKCPDVNIEPQEQSDETVTHCLRFSWESNLCLRTPSFYLRPGCKVHVKCAKTIQESIQQTPRLLTKTADGLFSLILERDATLPQPIPNEIEIRLEQVFEGAEHQSTPLWFYQILCSECNPSLNLSLVAGGNTERVLCTEKIFGHPDFTDKISNGFVAKITLIKHTCNHGDNDDYDSN